ncbi:MAG TPA: iron-containing redox enzyme family protein [Gemmatimonadales bacterium]
MSRPSNSERLRQKLDLLTTPARAASRALWTHPRFSELFPEYLFALHCSTRASVPLMQAARARAARTARVDPAAARLALYLTAHIPEERNHDQWLLDDLETLGVPRSEVLERVPPPSVAALVGSQYYWVLHHHPVALLGYIAVLEGYPPSAAEVERVIARTELPRSAFRTLLEHADLDRTHRDRFFRTLDRLPLTHEQSALVVVSGFWTLHLMIELLEDILEEYSPAPARHASRRRRASGA